MSRTSQEILGFAFGFGREDICPQDGLFASHRFHVEDVPMCHRLERYNPIALVNWLPRYFRHRFANTKSPAEVTFMLGSVIGGCVSRKMLEHYSRVRQ
jgi:hypothetical protein